MRNPAFDQNQLFHFLTAVVQFAASGQRKTGVDSSRDKNERHVPYLVGRGGRRAYHVTPDLSYDLEGEKEGRR